MKSVIFDTKRKIRHKTSFICESWMLRQRKKQTLEGDGNDRTVGWNRLESAGIYRFYRFKRFYKFYSDFDPLKQLIYSAFK